ncbi:MAG TPA: Ppx/GppA phosphatase family protein, partial [Vicinamibacterales bacterium]
RQVDTVLAAATSATREARNGGEFLARIERETGIRARIITGADEARLIHQAAVYGVDVGSGRAVVIDIGGGSVEITLGTAKNIQLARSFKLGVIRLTERFVKTDPISPRDERRLVRYVKLEIDEYLDQLSKAGFDRLIGTSGTILSLGAVATAGQGHPPDASLRNRRVSAKQLHRIRKALVSLDIEKRLRVPGLDPRRADIAVAGAVLIDTIVRRLGASELTLCDLSLREGLVLDYIARHRQQIAQVDRYPDVRRRSVIELAERCRYWPDHAQQVARLALQLFDATRDRHALGTRERGWLEFGALVHDIGAHISYESHHKHSYYLVKHGGLRGFDPHEIDIIGLIARYHRQATPKKAHEGFGDLPREHRATVRLLGAIVRLAEGLDRSHTQAVTGLSVAEDEAGLVVTLHTKGDAELELWAAHRHAEPLGAVLETPIRFVIAPAEADATKDATTHAEHARHAAHVPRTTVRRRRDRRLGQDDAARAPG